MHALHVANCAPAPPTFAAPRRSVGGRSVLSRFAPPVDVCVLPGWLAVHRWAGAGRHPRAWQGRAWLRGARRHEAAAPGAAAHCMPPCQAAPGTSLYRGGPALSCLALILCRRLCGALWHDTELCIHHHSLHCVVCDSWGEAHAACWLRPGMAPRCRLQRGAGVERLWQQPLLPMHSCAHGHGKQRWAYRHPAGGTCCRQVPSLCWPA